MKTRRGWHHRVHLRRYGAVDGKPIARIRQHLLEDAYDGGSEKLADDWALEVGEGEFVLYEDLGVLLAQLQRRALAQAVREQALAFAEMVADHGELGRVLYEDGLFCGVVREHVPDFACFSPTVSSRGELRFLTLKTAPLYAEPPRQSQVLQVRASLGGLLTPIVEEVLRLDG